MSIYKNNISHAGIYMIGDILRRSVSLIMLPIYTRYLSPADYGAVELLSMLIDFALIIFGARIGQAIFRFYCTAESKEDKGDIIASSLFLGLILNGIGFIVIVIFSERLAVAIFADIIFENYIVLFSITMLLLPFSEIPLTHIRAEKKPWLFFAFSILKLILQLGLNIYFVVYQEMHVEGVILSALISSAIMSVMLTTYSISKVGLRPKKEVCKRLFSFSLPLKLAAIGSFYLTFGDRYILNIYTDLTQVGIYSLGYKFGFVFMLLTWSPFEKMWDAEKYTIYKKPLAKQNYQRIFLYISSIMIFIGLCISLFTKDLLMIMSAPEFFSAYKIVPIIILAYIFQAWTKYCDLGILLQEDTKQIAYAEMFSAIIITVAYFTLIPVYGLYGAAWSTVVGFVARFYWVNRKGKQAYDMELPWGRVIFTLILAALIVAVSMFVPEDIGLSIFLRVVLVALFIIIFFTMPILAKSDKKKIYENIRKLKRGSII